MGHSRTNKAQKCFNIVQLKELHVLCKFLLKFGVKNEFVYILP